MKNLRNILYGAVLTLFTYIAADAQVSGTVYRDYNADGAKGQYEHGLADVSVKAFGANGSQIGATAKTDANGNYNLNVTAGTQVRIEFSGIPSGSYSGPAGTGSGTTVQFVTAPKTSVNLAAGEPSNYCEDGPKVVAPCYINGNPLAGGTAGSGDVLIQFPYNAEGANHKTGGTDATVLATGSQIGAVYGLAFQKKSQKMFSSAFIKRHAGLGPLGIGGLYATDMNTNTTADFINLTTLGLDFGTDPHTGLPANKDVPNNDAAAFDAVGKVGMGDIDLSDDGKTLYVVNLKTRSVHGIFINSPAVTPTASDVKTFAVPNPQCAGQNDFRPFGLKYWRGKLYVGVVCSAESSQSEGDVKGFIFEMDPTTGVFKEVMNFSFNYFRYGYCNIYKWRPWTTTEKLCNLAGYYPQPIIGDIEFDGDGAMIVGIMDRSGHQYGNKNYGTTGNQLLIGYAEGDILRAGYNGTKWVMESNGSVVHNGITQTTAGANNNEGPGGGEYYHGDATLGLGHHEVSMGSLAIRLGSGEILTGSIDPLSQYVYAGGLKRISNTTGAELSAYQIYSLDDPGAFGKASGLGDMEVMCGNPPVEVGNRVWLDKNGNGRQDADELGIQGVKVDLYKAGILVGTTTTGVGGTYYFNSNNVTGGIKEATSYEIRVSMVGANAGAIGTYSLAPENASGVLDEIDSDAVLSGDFASVTFLTGASGDNNHSYDFGFTPCPKDFTKPSVENAAICEGESLKLMAADAGIGATYTWTGPDSFTSSEQNPVIAISKTLMSGVYSLKVTKGACDGLATISVAVNTKPTFTVKTAEQPTCSVDLKTYSFGFTSTGGTVTVSAGKLGTNVVTEVPSGTDVTVTVTSPENCKTTLLVKAPKCACPVVDAPKLATGTTPEISICEGETIPTLTTTILTGETVDWYNVPTGGTPIKEASLTFTPTTSGTYYAEARHIATGCKSLTRTAVKFTINQKPTFVLTPPTASTPNPACSQDLKTYSITFTTNGTIKVTPAVGKVGATSITEIPNGTNISLEISSAAGCKIIQAITAPECKCPTVNVPQLEANGASNKTICEGQVMPSLTATVGLTETIDWYTTVTGGALLASGTMTYTPTSAGTYYAEARHIESGCTSKTRAAITLSIKPKPTISVKTVACATDLKTYSIVFTAANGTVSSSTGNVTDNGNGNYEVRGIIAGTNVTINVTGDATCKATQTVNAPDCACPFINPPSSNGNKIICEGETIPTISVAVGQGETADWYLVSSGGTAISVGSLSYLPTEGGIYYVEARNVATNCKSSTRTPISILVNKKPNINVTQTTCSANLLTYSVSVTATGGLLNASAGVVSSTGGDNYIINNIPKASNLTIEVVSVSGCKATKNVNSPNCDCPNVNAPTPDNSTTNGNGSNGTDTGAEKSICEGDIIPTFRMLVSGLNETTDWYRESSGGTPLLSGSVSFTPTSGGIYYAESRNTLTGCKSSTRTPVRLIIKPKPSVSASSNATPLSGGTSTTGGLCQNQELKLSANAVGGSTFQWAGPSGFTASIQNPTIQNVAKAATGVYTVTVNKDGCTNSTTINVLIEECLGSIGEGCVWNDINKNGVRDPGEDGIANVTVTLFKSDGTQVTNLSTDSRGKYTFTNVQPGDYYLVFSRPAGYSPSPRDQGGDDTRDSDPDPASGRTIIITLSPKETEKGWDAGFYGCPTVGFKYDKDLYCIANTTLTPIFSAGATQGTFSASPSGLSISSTTGIINPANSKAGTYTVRNEVPAVGACPAVAASFNVTLMARPNADFCYKPGYLCPSSLAGTLTIANPVLNENGTKGKFSSSPSLGAALNQNTGTITLTSSTTPGIYTLTNTIPASGDCPETTATTVITIGVVPGADFSYRGLIYCTTEKSDKPVLAPGSIGGSYSATPAGLSINAVTGEITFATSRAGTYSITNLVEGDGVCQDVKSSASITIVTADRASFRYNEALVCNKLGKALAIPDQGSKGGIFTASPSLGTLLDALTGNISLNPTIKPGTYTITNTIPAANGCTEVSASTTITIAQEPKADFNIIGSPFCVTNRKVQPLILPGSSTGTFSASPSGLSIDPLSGEIDLSTSRAGMYTIKHFVEGVGACDGTFTSVNITIAQAPIANFEYSQPIVCGNAGIIRPLVAPGGQAGVFSASPSLGGALDANTGNININTAVTPGTYIITNTVNATGNCPEVKGTATIKVLPKLKADFSYRGTYCVNEGKATITLGTGGTLGNFTATPVGLSLNNINGDIDLGSSKPGAYTITNSVVGEGDCPVVTANAIVTIVAQPRAEFCFKPSVICNRDTCLSPIFLNGGAGGVFSAVGLGGSIDPKSGRLCINNTLQPGTYKITNTIPAVGNCEAITSTAEITIIAAPKAKFSYRGGAYCRSEGTASIILAKGSEVGEFSAKPEGLSINTVTGDITLTTSRPGTYTVYNTLEATGSCPAVVASASISIQKDCLTEADLSLTKTCSYVKAKYGEQIAYTITVKNSGPGEATGIEVHDYLGADLQFISSKDFVNSNGTLIAKINKLGMGDTKSLTVTAKIVGKGNVINRAEIYSVDQKDGDSFPGNGTNNGEDDEDRADIFVPTAIDVSLSKAVNNTSPKVGEEIVYTLKVMNEGPYTATGIEIKDILPDGLVFVSSADFQNQNGILTASVANLAVNANKSLTFTARVSKAGTIRNVAEITKHNEEDCDSVPGNGTDNKEDDTDGVSIQALCKNLNPPVVTCGKESICKGESVTFKAFGCDGVVRWSNGEFGTEMIAKPTETTTYTAKCIAGDCTSDSSAPITIKALNLKVPTISCSKGRICSGESITLTSSGCSSTETVKWSNGMLGEVITISPNNSLTINASCRQEGCESGASNSLSIDVDKVGVPAIKATKTAICGNEAVTLTVTGCNGELIWSDGSVNQQTITVKPTTNTVYTAKCTVGGCTNESVPVAITVTPIKTPVVKATETRICSGSTVILTATGCNGSVKWSNGSFGEAISVSPNNTAVYSAYCRREDCESDASEPVTIYVDKVGVPSLKVDKTRICLGDQVVLTAEGCKPEIVVWSNGTKGVATITVQPTQATTYTAKCVAGDCANESSPITVTIDKVVPPTISCPKTAICSGESVTLTAVDCRSGQVRWSDGSTGETVTLKPTSTTTYFAICRKDLCDSEVSNKVTIEVSSAGKPVVKVDKAKICVGQSVTVSVEGCAVSSIEWNDGLKAVASRIMKPTTTATYSAKCSAGGCSNESGFITVVVDEALKAPIISCGKTQICYGETVSFTAIGCTGTIRWSDGSLSKTLDVKPQNTTTYHAVCTNDQCESEASNKITINVDKTTIPVITGDKNSVCLGDELKLKSIGCLGTIKWSDGSTGAELTVKPDKAITYTAKCIVGTCESISSNEWNVKVFVRPSTPQIACTKTEVCLGETITLSAVKCEGTVEWSNGQKGLSVTTTPLLNTTYSAVCSNGGECKSLVSNQIKVLVVTAIPRPTTSDRSIACINGTTTDLTTTVSSQPNTLTGSFEFHVDATPTSALVQNPKAVGIGTYYVFEKAGICYSSPSKILISSDCNGSTTGGTGTGSTSGSSSTTGGTSTGSTNGTTTPPSSVDVEVKLTANSSNVGVGNEIVFTFTAKNNGPNDANNVDLRYTIPTGLQYVKHTATSWIQVNVENGNLTAKIEKLAKGGVAEIIYTAKVLQVGRLINKFEIVRLDQQDTNAANDYSILMVNDPPIQLTDVIGISKVAGSPSLVRDGVYDIPFTITVSNMSANTIKKVQVKDDLTLAFGGGAVVLSEKIDVTTDTGLKANANYTGKLTNTLLLDEEASEIEANTSKKIRFTVRVDVNNATSERFYNSAELINRVVSTAGGRATETLVDFSQNGSNADPDKDGNPTNNNEPTPIILKIPAKPNIGLALAVIDTVRKSDNTFDVTYQVIIKNIGNVILKNIEITDTLTNVFNNGATFKVIGMPKLKMNKSELVMNPMFDGKQNPQLLIANNSVLRIGQSDTLIYQVNVFSNGITTPFLNTIVTKAIGGDKTVLVRSTEGFIPDPTMSHPTSISFPRIYAEEVFIPEGFSPNGDNVNDFFEIRGAENKTVSLTIYNRYGNSVYTQDAYQNDWDGYCNTGYLIGKDTGLPEGTYYAEVRVQGNKPIIKCVTIAR